MTDTSMTITVDYPKLRTTPLVHPDGRRVTAGELVVGKLYLIDRNGVLTQPHDEAA